jgi:hypothetical protein
MGQLFLFKLKRSCWWRYHAAKFLADFGGFLIAICAIIASLVFAIARYFEFSLAMLIFTPFVVLFTNIYFKRWEHRQEKKCAESECQCFCHEDFTDSCACKCHYRCDRLWELMAELGYEAWPEQSIHWNQICTCPCHRWH